MWTLKKQTNEQTKQNRNRLIDTENKLVVTTGEGLGGQAKQVAGIKRYKLPGFPGGAVVENLPANAGDTGSSPGPGRSHMSQST